MVFGVVAPNGALWAAAHQGATVEAETQTPTPLTPQTVDSRAVRARTELQPTENNENIDEVPSSYLISAI